MKKDRIIDGNVFEVLAVDGKEVIVNKTLPLRRQIEALHMKWVRIWQEAKLHEHFGG